ncbi:type VI secretion system protein TssL [Halomonas sp. 141]|uniref:Flagellar motor protein MotB n=2 Tax=Oceanospirillales TaxID=135619 RepID=A0ABQ2WDB3_9GAMM|nr:type VI secretion system protein TssL [Halomonas sp. 141]GGW45506.1 flagellar motor protein MotB [Halomonas johnsoniae]
MVTYADLMSLLLCFFVLLLSFAEIDAQKFRRVAESLSEAFGVQRDIEAMQIPMGTSAAMQHFSPATPDRTLIEEVRQRTQQPQPQLETMRTVLENQQRQRTLQIANSIEKLLATALSEGGVEIEVEEARIIIRVAENGTFGSGTATVTPAFASLLVELSSLLSGLSGTLSVHGHTDNVPIRTAQFRSNWDLSAMRAASVANVLIEDGNMAPERLIIQGFAETRPVASNTTSDGRAANRRVELLIDASAPVELAAMSSESSGDITP